MRIRPSVLHLDMDAFYASVEQRDKPSLRGKPVVVGGVGQRGVVATASYEARRFGVRSAMPSHEARRRCPNAAFLSGRFEAYRLASRQVMALLRELSPTIEPLSLDEAFVDLEDSAEADLDLSPDRMAARVARLQRDLSAVTGGLTASVGVATSKFMAKVASEMAKPAGIVIVEPGTEVELIAPLSVRAIPGVGPVTEQKLHTFGVAKVADLQRMKLTELNRLVGTAWGQSLHEFARAHDERHVEALREAKSISVEDTFEHDVTDRDELNRLLGRYSRHVAERIRKQGLFARTVTIKVKLADFTVHTRSRTLSGATDRDESITAVARSLLDGVDITEGVRLLGAGVASMTTIAQESLFGEELTGEDLTSASAGDVRTQVRGPGRFAESSPARSWPPGADVTHSEFGPGWVWGAGLGRVTVRFETAATGPGPVRTFSTEDERLQLTPVKPSDEAVEEGDSMASDPVLPDG